MSDVKWVSIHYTLHPTQPSAPIPHTLPLLRRAFDRHVQRKSAPSCARFSVTQVGDLNDGLADAVLVLYPRDRKARKVEQNLRASIFGRQRSEFSRAPSWFFVAFHSVYVTYVVAVSIIWRSLGRVAQVDEEAIHGA